MAKVIAYARFSPRPGAATCESVENQLTDLRAWCERHGHTEAGAEHDKDMSGGDRERAGCLAALDQCKRGYLFVVRDWSRLGRDTLFNLWLFEQLRSRGAQLVSATEGPFAIDDDPNAKLLSVIVSAIAEWQREMGRLRTSAGMRRNQAAGRRMSKIPPYGQQAGPDGAWEPCEAEQAVIPQIVAMRAEGAKLREIGRRLTAAGVKNRGNGWNHTHIAAILRRAGVA